jgi:uncharacterized protein with FMN-binding domain
LPSSKWKFGAAVFGIASIAGGFVVNAILNPPTTSSTVSGPTTEPDKTVTSDQMPYQYGVIELKVTKSAGKLTAIDVGGSSATEGRQQAFPTLVDEAIKAQGSSFGNLGGATYTTEAFKKALDNAIAKLG